MRLYSAPAAKEPTMRDGGTRNRNGTTLVDRAWRLALRAAAARDGLTLPQALYDQLLGFAGRAG